MRSVFYVFYTCLLLSLFSCSTPETKGSPDHIRRTTTSVDDTKITQGIDQDWLTHGLNYQENRYSTLDQIKKENLDQLGLAWSLDLGTRRGIEATPIVIDGIMFLTGPWSMVYAIDVRKGSLIWTYDPMVPRSKGENGCCDVVNRGVALYKGRVYVGTFDGRLIAIDAATGSMDWSIMTVDSTKPYSITGAPRIVKGNVIIGNGGAEYGVRGYITAYDATTGDQKWRFYTVPGNPALPFESEAMKKAAETWTGEWWKYGGGGTAWDAMAFDPQLNLLYVGTGNGSPWNRQYRSPDGGDNLYLSSIVALNPDSGTLEWYYQTTPGDTWDFTATQHIILADLPIAGRIRKVLMQAPKNGFFYVIDRATGEFISADTFVYVNWATGVDPNTGRPIESSFARFESVNADIAPNYDGGHNWHPMAYNPNTGLVYIPAREVVARYGHDPNWEYQKKGFGSGNGWNLGTGFNPAKPYLEDSLAKTQNYHAKLIGWNPVTRRAEWKVPQTAAWNGGLLTTKSNLLFQGTGDGQLIIYDAFDGSELWQTNLGGGNIAPPVTYMVDGKQYVSIAVGWGGGVGQKYKFAPLQPGRVFTFSLQGKAKYPSYLQASERNIADIPFSANKTELANGADIFNRYCSICHVLNKDGGGIIPNLTYTSADVHQNFQSIVRGGVLLSLGMPNFGDRLSEKDVNDLQKFILNSAKTISKK
ncbi:MAG: PQQ-dependent dehydrogenase, methanol/ethanol family [Saprospiraceae bacterium]|nr:PQQ-dependent dehydrogenase, methanol/ethanol family [Saprospiraceae bacterium]